MNFGISARVRGFNLFKSTFPEKYRTGRKSIHNDNTGRKGKKIRFSVDVYGVRAKLTPFSF